MGATFAGASCLVGSMRGKDDFWNHGIGAAAAASIVGARCKLTHNIIVNL